MIRGTRKGHDLTRIRVRILLLAPMLEQEA
jgi:hypothetical protein